MPQELQTSCMSLSEVRQKAEYNSAILGDWVVLAQAIWEKAPFYEVLSPEERLMDYGEKLGSPYGRVCFAQIGEEQVGYGWGYQDQEIGKYAEGLDRFTEGVRTCWYLNTVGVKKESRGLGIATRIFEVLIEEIRELGFTYIVFRTQVKEIRRIARKLGFVNTRIRDPKYTKRIYWVLEL